MDTLHRTLILTALEQTGSKLPSPNPITFYEEFDTWVAQTIAEVKTQADVVVTSTEVLSVIAKLILIGWDDNDRSSN
jgi:quinolinate synthase